MTDSVPISKRNENKVFQARELPLKNVTVFTDRAEIKRVFTVELQEGLTDVVVENVASTIDSDSVRVDGLGTATIHEVQFKDDYAVESETDSPQVKEQVEQLEKIKAKKHTIDDLKQVYEKRLKSLDNLIEKLHGEGEKSALHEDFNESVQENVENLFVYHEKKSLQVRSLIRSADIEGNELDRQIFKIEQQINEQRRNKSMKRSVVITLESFMQVKVELEIAYQVFDAFWTPSYDVRVHTSDISSGPTMRLFYFGNIRQSTGEDWDNVPLVLSTAQPRLGGPLPKLPTLRAKLHREPERSEEPQAYGYQRPSLMTKRAYALDSCTTESFACAPVARMAMVHSVSTAEKQSMSTTFLVPQRKTIPSDSSEHKVTIVALTFDPLLHFDCVPSKHTNVYLTASVINNSTYPLLAGSAAIYVDNSFSAKVQLEAVPTGDRFDCPIGVDSTVKVQHKPANKFQQQSGVLSKTASSMNEQRIIVKNTKNESVLLTIFQQVPKSTDEKIKVKLYSPDLKTNAAISHGIGTNDDLKRLKPPELGARLNDAHNLEWTLLLGEGEEKELVVKWGVEAPQQETVDYEEDTETC